MCLGLIKTFSIVLNLKSQNNFWQSQYSFMTELNLATKLSMWKTGFEKAYTVYHIFFSEAGRLLSQK